MTFVSKNIALRRATAEIQKSTGYGGLQKVLSSKTRSTAGGAKNLSKFSEIKNPAIKKVADIVIDDIDGGRFGADIKRKIQEIGSGDSEGKNAQDQLFNTTFNRFFDLFLDSEFSIKGNKGENLKTKSFAPASVLTEASNVGVGNSGKKGAKEQTSPTAADPNLTVINARHFDFNPTTSHLSEIEIFANAIPTHEFSRCVPFLDVKFQTAEIPMSKEGIPTGLNLARLILGPESVTNSNSNNLLVKGASVDMPPDSSGNPRQGSSFGMEMFTTPQTMIPLRTKGRQVPILDPFKPLMSIQSVDISSTPVAGLMEKRSGRMEIILHDRSRLHEIAELVRPENYGSNELLLEWGWSHPDNSGQNEYGRFLNALRVREKFSVYNSTFKLDGSGQVNISLDLMAKGSLDILRASILDNKTLAKTGQSMQQLGKSVTRLISDNFKNRDRKSIKPVFVLESHMSSNTNILATDLNELLKEIDAKVKKNASNNEKKALAQIAKKIKEINDKKQAFSSQKSEILKKIQQKLYEETTDPFHPHIKIVSGDTEKTLKEKSKKSKYISLGKAFSQFVGRPLLATNKYSEVQMIFYSFSSEAGAQGALGNFSVAEFLLDKKELMQGLDYLASATSSSEIPIHSFIQFVIRNFVQYPSSPLAPLTDANFIQTQIKERGNRPGPANTLARDKSGNLTKESKNKLDKHMQAIKVFRMPRVNVRFEAVPRISQNQPGDQPADADQQTILKVHVFDTACGRHDAFTRLLNAATDDLETLKQISQKLQEGRKKASQDKEDSSLPEMSRQISTLITEFEQDSDIIQKIEGTDPPEYRISIPFDKLKKKLAQNYPTLTYGTESSALINAEFGSIQDQAFKNLQLFRYGRDPNKSPSGADNNGLPLKIQPTNMSMTMLGCPLLKYANHFFVDFGTGTSADDMYHAMQINHSIRPGNFTTSVSMITRDADGKFESTLQLLNKASQFVQQTAESDTDPEG